MLPSNAYAPPPVQTGSFRSLRSRELPTPVPRKLLQSIETPRKMLRVFSQTYPVPGTHVGLIRPRLRYSRQSPWCTNVSTTADTGCSSFFSREILVEAEVKIRVGRVRQR